ncbi:MAG TPA: hypothetical protein VEA37_05500 [Flavobacterium sp.]|nr:hypothetical protein [Flavobacterium sp.]
MVKPFLYTLFISLALNFLVKTVSFFGYDQTEGRVIEYLGLTSINNSRRNYNKTTIIVPVIEYKIGGITYTAHKKKWGIIRPDIGEKYTVMYKVDPEDPEINGFLVYWLTLMDLAIVFSICVVATIIYGFAKFYITKNPEA